MKPNKRKFTMGLGDPIRDAIKDAAMPTVYPALTRNGLLVEMELPANTPPRVVLTINASTRLTRITDYKAEFPYRDYDRIKDILLSEFGRVEEVDHTPPVVDPRVTPITLFVEYVGQCRSRDKGTAGMATCAACAGRGYLVQGGRSGGGRANPFNQFNCAACNGSGRSMSTPTSTAYASAWVDGGWSVIFPEPVLRAYFGEPETKFDGDFYAYLLASKDLSKAYKHMARKYHPDLNRAASAVPQFIKLKEAYETLKDPMRRKRYQAGLAFQAKALQSKVNEVVFWLPKTCGDVTVKGAWEPMESRQDFKQRYYQTTYGQVQRDSYEDGRKRLHVSEIISWNDRLNAKGERMVSKWDRNAPDPFRRGYEGNTQKPFIISWESTEEFEIKVSI